MTRPLRIQYPGALYHVTCRGNERKDIYQDDTDRRRFLHMLRQSLHIYSVKLYSYVLMTNHFHLLLETPLGNLSEFMRHFNISYTSYYNRRHQRVGHLYQGRYQSILVEKDSYLSALSRYVHLNPVRIKTMEEAPGKKKIEHLLQYPWSSLPGYLKESKKQPFVDYAALLGEFGGSRREYQASLLSEIGQGTEIKGRIIGQSILGGEAFVAWVREKFIGGAKNRECPSAKEIHQYRSQRDILQAIQRETGRDIETIRTEKGELRQIGMDLLYRVGRLKGPEIGRIFGLDYASVSQERRRLREKLRKDPSLQSLLSRIEGRLSTSEI
jgi:putative transposase